ncbi:MAG: hypothetical protein ACPIOQ_69680, partial [Promethearchaeia archaeon]
PRERIALTQRLGLGGQCAALDPKALFTRQKRKRRQILCPAADAEAAVPASERAVAGRCLQWH